MIAVLGATGFVGHSLALALAAEGVELYLFARTPGRLALATWPTHVNLRSLDAFRADQFRLVINAIGAGDPVQVAAMGATILNLTQAWDQRILSSMGEQTRYVFLSSGAIYGACETPPNADSLIALPVNRLETVPPYVFAKLAAEMGHRQLPDRSILDVRIFGYADPGIDLTGSSFLAELARSLKARQPFITSRTDMVREYTGASDLRALIAAWEQAGAPNMPVDLYSRAPVRKLMLLDEITRRYGLEVRYRDAMSAGPTGAKPFYASSFRAAAELGYVPGRDALAIVLDMFDRVIAR